ncbi:MAG: hypothetical protein ACYS0H_12615 [Planctomycetota bacterium]|jgi:hypothetical protein
MITPPDGSRITDGNESGYKKLVIAQPSRGLRTYFSCIFWIFWLVIWAFGWIGATVSLVDKSGAEPPELSFIIWFCFWTVGGVYTIWALYKSVRPAVPEALVLSRPSLVYDSGIEPVRSTFYYRSREEVQKKLSQKRIRTEFDMIHLKTLQLQECEGGSKLTMDQGARRIEIGKGATETERKWLFELINREYDL